jgi:hypothetical protein
MQPRGIEGAHHGRRIDPAPWSYSRTNMRSSDIFASAKTETNDTVFEEDKHSYNSMVIGLVTKFSTPRGGLNIALVPTVHVGTSRE